MIALESANCRLTTLEGVIERGLQTFVAVGNALDEISRDDLYKATHPTFEAYCRERWGLSRKRGYDFIAAARVVANVSQICDIRPVKESHVYPLAPLKPDEQRTAWAAAVDRAGGKPTGAIVAEVVKEMKQLPIRPVASTAARGVAIERWEPAASEGGDTPEAGATRQPDSPTQPRRVANLPHRHVAA